MGECEYCKPDYQASRKILENELFFADFDHHPVSPGHMKVIPKRHVNSICELTEEESIAMVDLIRRARELIDNQYHPDAYNLGINEGAAAGQTVFHLHVHIIPRYKGDVDNPTGGVRNIIPGKGNYLK